MVANEFNNFSDYEGKNCYLLSENGCFVNCNKYSFKKDFTKDYFEFIRPYERGTDVMTKCRIAKFCGRYKIDVAVYDFQSRRILARSVIEKKVCSYIQ